MRLVFRVSHAPTPRRRGHSAPQFWVFLSMRTPFVAELYQIWRGNAYWDGACFMGQPRPHPKGSGSQCSSMLGSFLFMVRPLSHNYQIWRGDPLTQNDQIRRGNTYGEGRVLWRSATSLHLRKCVARFVSDSWVSCCECIALLCDWSVAHLHTSVTAGVNNERSRWLMDRPDNCILPANW